MSERSPVENPSYKRASTELAAMSKSRLKLHVSVGALIAILSGSHVIDGILSGTLSSKGVWMFGLALGVYFIAHHTMLLLAKRALKL